MHSFTSRFERPSSLLQVSSLLARRRKALWLACVAAIGIHLSLTRVSVLEAEQKAAKPLTTQFVKRQPRLTKPLELKKRPQPRQRRIRRKMVAVRARARREGLARPVEAAEVAGSLARPMASVGRSVWFERDRADPRAMAEAVEGSKDPRNRVDMALDLVDIQALDTGQYHALVLQDPTDKRNITGFFHFARGFSRTMRHTASARYNECEWRQERALKHLVIYMNGSTDIRTDYGGNVPLDSQEVLKVPWVYLGTSFVFQLCVSELEYLGKYLVGGGFLFAEDLPASGQNGEVAAASFRNMFREALAHQDIPDREFERIPNSHPIYHCYFDFPDGPPLAGDARSISEGGKTSIRYDYLEGLFLEGDRMAAILSLKWYASPWGDWGPGGGHSTCKWDPTRPLQLGVNTLIFALTQEGSITHRLMDGLR